MCKLMTMQYIGLNWPTEAREDRDWQDTSSFLQTRYKHFFASKIQAGFFYKQDTSSFLQARYKQAFLARWPLATVEKQKYFQEQQPTKFRLTNAQSFKMILKVPFKWWQKLHLPIWTVVIFLFRALTLVLHPLPACSCLSFPPSLCSQQFFLKDAKWCRAV